PLQLPLGRPAGEGAAMPAAAAASRQSAPVALKPAAQDIPRPAAVVLDEAAPTRSAPPDTARAPAASTAAVKAQPKATDKTPAVHASLPIGTGLVAITPDGRGAIF